MSISIKESVESPPKTKITKRCNIRLAQSPQQIVNENACNNKIFFIGLCLCLFIKNVQTANPGYLFMQSH